MVDGVAGMCEGIQLRDFPAYIHTTDRNNIKLNFFMREAERLSSLPDGVIFNTFDDLERPALDAMRSVLPMPLYTVGPLCLHVCHAISTSTGSQQLDSIGSNLWQEQDDVLEWLDGRALRSVVYLNFGSIAMITGEQLMQFALGLVDSGYCFLWNIRPGFVKGEADLPPKLLAAVEEGKGKLSTWCPQEKVLQHEAIGLFLTHSGWNSTMESISAGVPMLCWPCFADQPTNCRYVRTEWGNGTEIPPDVAVRRAELAVMIQEAIRGEKTWRRAQEWKEKAQVATLTGGSSVDNLGRLINEVLQTNHHEEQESSKAL
ncbi:hypothetical protein PR202_gb21064 [Eleusine coracana subsp. coracana]|uniref:UDP-glycosyltransferases domain-containing protein n=1 Tax=Eleusine coracana subsp. coracana TaxID=191504 RepID=A0AAV5FE51_ELECO|nr:hypothetical protein PR202_gb21064 [Eleusine coracana subsp. coracana]